MRARKGRQTPVGGVGQGAAAVGRRSGRARAGGQPGAALRAWAEAPEAASLGLVVAVGQRTAAALWKEGVKNVETVIQRMRRSPLAELRGALDAAAAEGTGVFLTERGVKLVRGLLDGVAWRVDLGDRRGP